MVNAAHDAVLSGTFEGLFVPAVSISVYCLPRKLLLDKGNLIILRGVLTV